MLDPHGMYKYALKMSSQGRPVKLRVGPVGIYILFGPKSIKMIFKNSKVLSKEDSSLMIFRGSGMTQEDMQIFEIDKSGPGRHQFVEVSEERRVWKRTHDLRGTHLANGHLVNALTCKFIGEFISELGKLPIGQAKTSSLYDFFKKARFVASEKSLVGTEIFRLNLDLVETYLDYDDSFLLMAIGLPEILYWKGHAARDRMLNAAKKWIKSASQNFDGKNVDAG
ncbi:uncharacterized protein BP5553_04370 [Venustampulla echinocandica]|uniref:Uncharacterized protein n=1 Tax=Venustampulla echinocandica TaxID=2656787 RepID=A0A370TN43_9HELO|nr:uncharacterized protein BP5553_04370 [Venustampulla echinocandica]RDL36937.1 hypothetical protein BP5553_04370 [Venustampulla echinocandica]